MIVAWYVILALMLAAFAVTEGWDFGVGVLHLLVGRSCAERRHVIKVLGPLWNWNEVWLIAAGGTLFFAFPSVLATALPGYYLAVFLFLWCLVLRGIALEVSGHVDDAMWQVFWDFTFSIASILLALLFGAAFGNILRGVPLGPDGKMFLPFFTDFTAKGQVGLIDWYTASVAVFTLVVLAAHGGAYLAVRADGAIERRGERMARRFWIAALILLPLISWETSIVRPGFFAVLIHRGAAWPAAAAFLGGIVAFTLGLIARKQRLAFAGSCLFIAGMIGGAAAAMFPEMLHSTLAPGWSMTATDGAADGYGLKAALVWWPIALVLSLMYAGFVARKHRGKVRASD